MLIKLSSVFVKVHRLLLKENDCDNFSKCWPRPGSNLKRNRFDGAQDWEHDDPEIMSILSSNAFYCFTSVLLRVFRPPFSTPKFILTTSLIHCSLKGWENVLFELARKERCPRSSSRFNPESYACSLSVSVEILFLFWGIHLCYNVRKAPSAFNESKFISWSIYNMTVVTLFLKITR